MVARFDDAFFFSLRLARLLSLEARFGHMCVFDLCVPFIYLSPYAKSHGGQGHILTGGRV